MKNLYVFITMFLAEAMLFTASHLIGKGDEIYLYESLIGIPSQYVFFGWVFLHIKKYTNQYAWPYFTYFLLLSGVIFIKINLRDLYYSGDVYVNIVMYVYMASFLAVSYYSMRCVSSFDGNASIWSFLIYPLGVFWLFRDLPIRAKSRK